jgi:hypothetical protein
MSVYYYAKFYYLLWFFWWIVIANALDTIEVKNNEMRYAKIYGLLVALAYICCFGRIDKRVPKELLINDSGLIGTGLYTYNFSFIDNDYEDYEYPTENIELNSYVIDITKDGKNAVLIDYIDGNKSIYDARWFRAMTGCANMDSYELEKIIEKDMFYDYYVVIKGSIVYNEAKEYIGKYNIAYENEAGIVISK